MQQNNPGSTYLYLIWLTTAQEDKHPVFIDMEKVKDMVPRDVWWKGPKEERTLHIAYLEQTRLCMRGSQLV